MLKLNDGDLARLRLEVLKSVGGVWPKNKEMAEDVLDWCLNPPPNAAQARQD